MRVLVEAYGCTLNRGEAAEFIESILGKGHELAVDDSEADAYAIFTCGVIETTENHMLKRISEMARQPSKQLLVCGCLGNINRQGILNIAPHARIFGPAEQEPAGDSLSDVGEPTSPNTESKIGILPIATGCLGNCAYCITKEARGGLHSRRISQVKEKLEKLVARGCVEIQICAQDTAVYGMDSENDLADLIEELATVPGDYMLRIGMMNSAHVKDNLASIIKAYESENVFKFLHLPVQSGSDRMLAAMKRDHTAADFVNIVEQFRTRFPNMVLSTDIIVGFPGETEEDFQASMGLVEKIKPDVLNITRFSSRPGTEAHDMPNQVSGSISKERSRAMTELRFGVSRQHNERFLGMTFEALATEYRTEGATFLRTRDYRPIEVQGVRELGKWYPVEISAISPTHLVGAWSAEHCSAEPCSDAE